MASLPVRDDVSASSLDISLPMPVAGDPYTFLASSQNAALAVAAAYESADADGSVVAEMGGLTGSPMFLSALACYRRDLREIAREQPADAAHREEFVLHLLCARMYLGGTMHNRLPREVRRA